jgi:hypothetical protein
VAVSIWYTESKKYKGDTVEGWTKRLDSESARPDAFEALGHFGPEAKGAVPRLIGLLEAKGSYERIEASAGFAGRSARREWEWRDDRVIRESQFAARPGGETAADREGQVAEEKAREFVVRERAAGEAESSTRRSLTESLLEERIGAAETLGRIGPAAKAALPALHAVANQPLEEKTNHRESELRLRKAAWEAAQLIDH